MFMYLHSASWHFSATLTEVFRAFSSVVRQMLGYISQRRGTARTFPKIFVLFYVLFVLCRSVYCLCVNVYCTTATGWLPSCSLTNISYTSIQVCSCACQTVYHGPLGFREKIHMAAEFASACVGIYSERVRSLSPA
jgi:hypothetical protein